MLTNDIVSFEQLGPGFWQVHWLDRIDLSVSQNLSNYSEQFQISYSIYK